MIYATIDCTDDGENGFPHRQAAGVGATTTELGNSPKNI